MSEKINPNTYLLPAEFMEPQRPVTPDGYSVVDRDKIESERLRTIPDSLSPVFMQSETGEKAVKSSEFRIVQDAAYAEREKNRNAWIERSLGSVALDGSVENPIDGADDTMDKLFDPNYDAESLSVEGAAVRPELTEEEILEANRKSSDAAAWQANIVAHERSKYDREQ